MFYNCYLTYYLEAKRCLERIKIFYIDFIFANINRNIFKFSAVKN
ncbi:hypothetical protein SAMN05421765_0714 [Kaistella antarctica]|uniref:Uncharacterized protein n=1 Tax=Kaistella antarctica TaxID=266748 RepID=A0A448NTZ7_9FLAO|nr:hypothetical protein SAMN05421765_0714 [Kaistella antarctica]VEI01049.1 Uncharacterised protein [Kaistella antarctica]